jgi:hypothetical protein
MSIEDETNTVNKASTANTQDQERLWWEADLRAAMEIHRLVQGLELAGPDRQRRIEPHLVWLIARNAGYHNLSPSFLRFVRRALAEGRKARRAQDKASLTDRQNELRPDSEVKGNA